MSALLYRVSIVCALDTAFLILAVHVQAADVIDLGALGGTSSRAFGINNLGQVVGDYKTSDGHEHAFVWQDGVMTPLSPSGEFSDTVARGINDAGTIVGLAGTTTDLANDILFGQALQWDAAHTNDITLLDGT